MQHSGFSAQTHSSTSSTPHPAVPLSTQHCPSQLPHSLALATQSASHSPSQQMGLSSHTHSAMEGSLQPGVKFTLQQGPEQAPHSEGQLSQFSLRSQKPFPQNPSQTPSLQTLLAEQVQSSAQLAQFSPTPQNPSPQHPPQLLASSAQKSSQMTVQQKGSSAQTQSSISSSSHPGERLL